MRGILSGGSGIILIIILGAGVVGSSFLYGTRGSENTAAYNDRLQIDGQSEETWKRNVGEGIIFRCITGQKTYPIFVWTKDGKPLPKNVVKYELISNGNSFLEIPKASIAHEGNYTCTVTNDFGVARKLFKLCMIAPGVKEDCPGWWYNWK